MATTDPKNTKVKKNNIETNTLETTESIDSQAPKARKPRTPKVKSLNEDDKSANTVSKEAKTSKDVKPSKDDKPSKEAKTSKDDKSSKEAKTSKDDKSSKEAKPKETNASKSKEAKTSKDDKPSKDAKTSKDVKPKETKTSKSKTSKAAAKIDPTSPAAIKATMKKLTEVDGPVIINKKPKPVKVTNKATQISKTPKKAKVTPKTEPKKAVPKVKERKIKLETKEEKQAFKKLGENFNYIANLTWVIEEKMMDQKAIPDLTLGEVHVIEVVDQYNDMPMTTIANALKVTVGSLITCINRLVAKEYIIRTRDEKDKRVIKLSVTPKAKKILKVHDKFHEEILYGILEGVTIRDASKVLAQVARVLENYINPKEKINVITTSITKKSSKGSK